MQVVIMGQKVFVVVQELFKGDCYSDYLYFYGFVVQMVEVMVEWVYVWICLEFGFVDLVGIVLWDVLVQWYCGSWYFFGYFVCLNVVDFRQQLEWFGVEWIGLSMDVSDQFELEQSIIVLVVFYFQVCYFSV